MNNLNENQFLLNYRKDVTSQFGEDGIIEKIFEIINDNDNWCVEFGAWDGKRFSNTWNLINNKSYSAVQIEANPVKFNELKKNYSSREDVYCINTYVNFSGPDSLDNLLSKTPIPLDFDFLSIDIDGNDYHIWDSLKKYTPKVILIEYNAFIPDCVSFIQEKNMNVQHGNSVLAFVNLAKSKGYELICINQENAFFVKKEYLSLFNIKNNSITALKHFRNPLNIFQLYDGTLVVDGSQTLYYYGFPFEINNKIQILPKLIRNAHIPWVNHKESWYIKLIYKFYIWLRKDPKHPMFDHAYNWSWKEKYESLL